MRNHAGLRLTDTETILVSLLKWPFGDGRGLVGVGHWRSQAFELGGGVCTTLHKLVVEDTWDVCQATTTKCSVTAGLCLISFSSSSSSSSPFSSFLFCSSFCCSLWKKGRSGRMHQQHNMSEEQEQLYGGKRQQQDSVEDSALAGGDGRRITLLLFSSEECWWDLNRNFFPAGIYLDATIELPSAEKRNPILFFFFYIFFSLLGVSFTTDRHHTHTHNLYELLMRPTGFHSDDVARLSPLLSTIYRDYGHPPGRAHTHIHTKASQYLSSLNVTVYIKTSRLTFPVRRRLQKLYDQKSQQRSCPHSLSFFSNNNKKKGTKNPGDFISSQCKSLSQSLSRL